MTPLSLRRTHGEIFRRRDLIFRAKILMLNGLATPLILLLLIDGRTLLKMITVTRILKLTLNIVGIENAKLSLSILPESLLEIVFLMTSQAVQTCLTLKM